MRFPLASSLTVALLLAAPADAQNCATSGQTTTHFLGGNGANGNMFDIDVGAQDIVLECIDMHAYSVGALLTVEVYYCPVTSFGNEQNAAAWTLLATVPNVVGAPGGQPTQVDLSGNGMVFQAGQTYGIHIVDNLLAGATFAYTNGGPTTFTGAHCDLTTNCGTTQNFGIIFAGREFNGTLHTEVHVPAPTLAVVGGCGQPGSGLRASNMSPGGPVGFAASPTNTGATVPAGTCGPTAIDLGLPLVVLGVVPADASGSAAILPPNGIPAVACGWYAQAMDLVVCVPTNSLQL